MVPYFLSQHPLSSRGKSIPKVKGHPGGIPFVFSLPCRICSALRGVFLSIMKACAFLSFCCSPKYLVSLICFELIQVQVLNSRLVSLLCSPFLAVRHWMKGSPSRERKVSCSVQWRRRSVLVSHQYNNTALYV